MSDLASMLGIADARETCWLQWEGLAGSRSVWTEACPAIVDPEALVLASLAYRARELRFDDQLLWMARSHSQLLSVQRLRSLVPLFPARIVDEVRWFAAEAFVGGDARWRSLHEAALVGTRGRPGKAMPSLKLRQPAAIMLRLRAAIGVGAKADLLTVLLGSNSGLAARSLPTTVESLAVALGYSVAATRRAAGDMANAGFLTALPGRPVRYLADAGAWSQLLVPRSASGVRENPIVGAAPSFPPWCCWAQVFAFVLACEELGNDTALAAATTAVQASYLRDLLERFARPLSWLGIAVAKDLAPVPIQHTEFRFLLEAVMQWIDERR